MQTHVVRAVTTNKALMVRVCRAHGLRYRTLPPPRAIRLRQCGGMFVHCGALVVEQHRL
jgi:hypothetical protein